ncbi:hypothetical protein [Sinomicrobium sp. M5D2P9]
MYQKLSVFLLFVLACAGCQTKKEKEEEPKETRPNIVLQPKKKPYN